MLCRAPSSCRHAAGIVTPQASAAQAQLGQHQRVVAERRASITRNADPTFFRTLWRGKAAREAKVAEQSAALVQDEAQVRLCASSPPAA